MDKSGNLYGTTFGVSGNGTVFELTPPAGQGNWTESVLWNFGNPNDGHSPVYRLLMDTGGNLYGTTFGGGDHGQTGFLGTVFELAPPFTAGGPWTESVLWSFAKSHDGGPGGSLIMDSSGNLYGTTAAATTSRRAQGDWWDRVHDPCPWASRSARQAELRQPGSARNQQREEIDADQQGRGPGEYRRRDRDGAVHRLPAARTPAPVRASHRRAPARSTSSSRRQPLGRRPAGST